MATRKAPPSRYLAILFLLIAGIYALVFFAGGSHTPQLGLDLRGGTTVTLTAKTPNGQAPSKEDLELARQIIERRVNGLGVAGAEVVTQGDSNIIISVPGENQGEKARELGTTAQLRFRPVVKGPEPVTPAGATPSASAAPSGSAAPSEPAAPSGSASAAPSGSAAPSSPAAGSSAPAAPSGTPVAGSAPVTQEQAETAYATLTCEGSTEGDVARPQDYVAACGEDGKLKYLLGPTIIEGTEVTDARAGTQQTTGEWIVLLDFNSSGRTTWANYTAEHIGDYVAFTLDGRVVSAPVIQGAINGETTITGNFDQQSADELANQLKYGALPLTFSQATAQSISTELGQAQLDAGLIAGAIGIALVFVYAILYYRLLGIVMIASLVASAALVYGCIVLLSRQVGLTLSLAGIAGFIVAIGITADSFVVYFERLKDEIREGRTLRSAVPRAWVRARRTILSADAVSFLAAAILYWLAIGDVKGFAFTLGLSTVLDLVIVFLFTHPLMELLGRNKWFSHSRHSGFGRIERRRPATPQPTPAGRELVGAGAAAGTSATGAQDRSRS